MKRLLHPALIALCMFMLTMPLLAATTSWTVEQVLQGGWYTNYESDSIVHRF